MNDRLLRQVRPATILCLTAPLAAVALTIWIGDYSRRKAYERPAYERPAYEQQSWAWLNLGNAHAQAKDYAQARQCWETALTYPEGYGYWHFRAHQNLRALAYIDGREGDMMHHDAEVTRLREQREGHKK